jgi:hypothetical protein
MGFQRGMGCGGVAGGLSMHRICAAAGTPVVPGGHRGANLQDLLWIRELLVLD